MNRATLSGIFAVLFWSTTVAFSRILSESLGTLTTGALIYILGGALGLTVFTRQPGGLGQMLRMPKRYLFGCGALFVSYMLLLYLAIGLAHNSAQVVAVGLANYLWPSLILLFSIPLLGKRARFWLIPGILLALAGTWIAVLQSGSSALTDLLGAQQNLLPVVLAACAAVLWGVYSNLTRKWASDAGSAVPLFLLASGLVFLILRGLSGELSRWDWGLVLPLLYMAVFPAWLGYQLWDIAMQRGDMPLVTAFSYFTPLLSTLISLLVLQVQPSPLLGLAALLVTGGAVVSKLAIVD
ncbi:MAG: EamA family transporter [Chloroflexi bacterium HGW-Chloroflexi-6]|nr:MAG: EamA family transporter [Chloroflexi bacterium HGW-Chloroflexi-6]